MHRSCMEVSCIIDKIPLANENYLQYNDIRKREKFSFANRKDAMCMSRSSFEALLGFHGAPTFAGEKPAVLLSFKKSQFEDFDAMLASFTPCFRCKGISVLRLVEGEEYVLVLFYRARRIARFVKRADARALLRSCGYDDDAPLSVLLAELQRRMEIKKTFPHEIGIFLGYPPEDVRGFIEHRGKDFALSGYWKVYGNPDAARALFARYTACSEEFCKKLDDGARFEDLVIAS